MSDETPQKPSPSNRRRAARRKPRGYVKLECRKGSIGLGANVGSTLLDVSETGARLVVRQELQSQQDEQALGSLMEQCIKRFPTKQYPEKLSDPEPTAVVAEVGETKISRQEMLDGGRVKKWASASSHSVSPSRKGSLPPGLRRYRHQSARMPAVALIWAAFTRLVGKGTLCSLTKTSSGRAVVATESAILPSLCYDLVLTGPEMDYRTK